MKHVVVDRPRKEETRDQKFAWLPVSVRYNRGNLFDLNDKDFTMYHGWMWLEHYVESSKSDSRLPIALAVELKLVQNGKL